MEDFFPRCDASEPGKLCSGVKLKEHFEAEFLKKKKKHSTRFFLSGVKLIDFLDFV